MADLEWTQRPAQGGSIYIQKYNGTASVRIVVRSETGVDSTLWMTNDELRDLAGGLAIVRDYR